MLHPVPDSQPRSAPGRTGQKRRDIRRRMLPVPIHHQHPLESSLPSPRPTGTQRRPLAARHLVPNHLRARLRRSLRRGIPRAVINHDHLPHLLTDTPDQRPDVFRLIQAGNQHGAVYGHIHGPDAKTNTRPAKENIEASWGIRVLPERNWFAKPRGSPFTQAVMYESFSASPELLKARGSAQEGFHQLAARSAAEQFGRKVFLRGVVEVSNYCRENCAYCGMRRDNRSLARFRARYEELAEMLIHHRPGSITDLNIQTGEDPVAVREVVLPLIRTLRRETPLGISVCLGALTPGLYQELQEAGATIYIMKFEMADPASYERCEAPGTLHERLEHIRLLARQGWKVSSGFIAGLPGQSTADLLANFQLASQLPLSGCSVSPFIPGEATPLSNAPMADLDLTLNCMATLRLLHPEWVIPAVSALNLANPTNGYRRGLRTGANLVTINLTPSELRDNYLLYKRDRFIMTEELILSAIATENLQPSSQSLERFYQARQNKPLAQGLPSLAVPA